MINKEAKHSYSACYLSAGIGKIHILGSVLSEYTEIKRHKGLWNTSCDHVLGWGQKPTARCAQVLAHKLAKPYVALEDGFLRSFGLGVMGHQPHSLVVDYSGIYYDASKPSDLESLISNASADPRIIQRARHAIEAIKYHRLSKYNHAPDYSLDSDNSVDRVLVVDQTFGDVSISLGSASAASFAAMLQAAIAEHPRAEIWVKIHPDVISGKKQGYLLQLAQQHNCRIISSDINPWALFDAVKHVYVVTSQMGFEALMAGLQVTCFGQPFYAGWGLTDDRQPIPRRNEARTLEQVFAAAYLFYSRYANPYTGQRCELEDTINLIADQKHQHTRLKGTWLGIGFSRWKQRYVDKFLGGGSAITFTNQNPPDLRVASTESLLVWASQASAKLKSECETQGRQLWRMEDGFVRSVGLGVDLASPMSLIIDSSGIYYDATQPSDLENLLAQHPFPASLLTRAKAVRSKLVTAKLSKYNVGSSHPLHLPEHKRLILVPGQVESDASIAHGSPQIKTNHGLLEAVRNNNPDAFVIYKPHPDVLSGGRAGELPTESKRLYDLLVTDLSMPQLLEQVDEVHTLCSLTGFEALLRGIKVFTYGLPFYAGWGLSEDLLRCERRTRRLTLDQLVAATLILYPTYLDQKSGQICNVETAIELLIQKRNSANAVSLRTKLYRCYRNIFEGRK